jgi:hypothetical protein
MNELSDNLRRRVLEVLALVADAEAQRKYQASVLHVNVSEELFNQWDDAFFPEDSHFISAFSSRELDVLRRFNAAMETVGETTPNSLPSLDAFMQTQAWHRLSDAARFALDEIEKTGSSVNLT